MNSIESIRVGQLEVRYLVDGTSNNKPGLFELVVPPGAHTPPPHSHDNNDEYIYVVEGVLRYRVNETERDLGVGEHMVSPRGSVHAFSNPGTTVTRALITQFPDIGPQYFRDVAEALGAGGPPNFAKVAAIMGKYGLVLHKPGSTA